MKPIHIATSPLTNRIFAGHVLKCGAAWAANKQDVTGAACGAVCEHVMANGGTVEVTLNGKPKFEITVRDVEVGKAQAALGAPNWPVFADPFTYVIQHLNSNPYSLTKDECIALIKELRGLYNAAPEATS